jgi:3-dehydroquinate synthase
MAQESETGRSIRALDRPSFSTQQFQIDFSFPIHFTQHVFDPSNKVLLDVVNQLESERRHRVFFAIDESVASACPSLEDDIRNYLSEFSHSMELLGTPLVVPGGEASKNDFSQVLAVMAELNQVGIDRHSFVVVIGGGAVLDMVCFAASIAHRGIRVIRVPTTVLAQADSGVGVKNGVNLFGKKNFAGTFAPPFAVINDGQFLETLSRRDKISGIAESVKVALIRDRRFFEFLEDNVIALSRLDPALLSVQIRRCAELHVRHIGTSGDPFELGSARPLDFGHWAAHKLESMTSSRLRHGEAVAIGMAVDLIYSSLAGYLSDERRDRALQLLETLGFNLWDDAIEERDAKGGYTVFGGIEEFREHLGGKLHITLIREIGYGFEVTDMRQELLIEAIQQLKARSETRITVNAV